MMTKLHNLIQKGQRPEM